MIQAMINGRNVSVPVGTTILDAAASVGIDIPTLCYLKDISNIASCRVCVVEVEGLDKLVTSCNTLLKEGMVIETESPRVVEARKTVLNLILAEHNQMCFSCLKNTACALQACCNRYGIERSSFPVSPVQAKPLLGQNLVYREDLCIRCQRCVGACVKSAGKGILRAVKDGAVTRLDMPFATEQYADECAACGMCADACPVGALTRSGVSFRKYCKV